MLILIWSSILLALIFLTFIIGRFMCKRCEAMMTERDEAFKPDNRVRYLCGTFFLTIVSLVSTSSLVFGALGYWQLTSNSTESLVEQASVMNSDVDRIYKNAERYNELLFSDEYKRQFGLKPLINLKEIKLVMDSTVQSISDSATSYQ
jgi:hypothetical protein